MDEIWYKHNAYYNLKFCMTGNFTSKILKNKHEVKIKWRRQYYYCIKIKGENKYIRNKQGKYTKTVWNNAHRTLTQRKTLKTNTTNLDRL